MTILGFNSLDITILRRMLNSKHDVVATNENAVKFELLS